MWWSWHKAHTFLEFAESNIKSSRQLAIPPDYLHAIIYQACGNGIDLPDHIVKELHPLHIPGVDFLHNVEDSAFGVLWNCVQEEAKFLAFPSRRPERGGQSN